MKTINQETGEENAPEQAESGRSKSLPNARRKIWRPMVSIGAFFKLRSGYMSPTTTPT